MKLVKILPKLKNKETKYICSKSLAMYDQNLLSLKFWLVSDNFQNLEQMIKAKDWKTQDKRLGHK